MNKIAVIGSSRFTALKNLVITHSTAVKTPYGDPSAPLSYGLLAEHEVIYLPRRGSTQKLPAHRVNYRANMWALQEAGVQTILATVGVAGINPLFLPGNIVLPDQLIDYTFGRENTFLGEELQTLPLHFSYPYNENLRNQLLRSKLLTPGILSKGTYGITQGPRLETLAEIKRLAQDGCDIVGMTGMPEASLAAELRLEYVCIALVVRMATEVAPLAQYEDKIEVSVRQIDSLIENFILEKN